MNRRAVCYLALFCLMAILSSAQLCAATTASVNRLTIKPLVKMRQHGYQLGDVLVEVIEIPLTHQQTLDPRSLPLPGPVRPWLDLRAVTVTDQAQGVAVRLEWQVFATVDLAQRLPLPALDMKVIGQPSGVVRVPSYSFYLSPVLGNELRDIERKTTHVPLLYPVSGWQWLAVAGFLGSVLFALCALWLRDVLPWWPFHPGPLLSVQRYHTSPEQPEVVQRLLYQALCQTAGCLLHADTLAQLFERAPWLSRLQVEISGFVLAYVQQQYGYQPIDAGAQTSQLPRPDHAWLAQAAMLERFFCRIPG